MIFSHVPHVMTRRPLCLIYGGQSTSKKFWKFLVVDLGGIEPPTWLCHSHALPLRHRPISQYSTNRHKLVEKVCRKIIYSTNTSVVGFFRALANCSGIDSCIIKLRAGYFCNLWPKSFQLLGLLYYRPHQRALNTAPIKLLFFEISRRLCKLLINVPP